MVDYIIVLYMISSVKSKGGIEMRTQYITREYFLDNSLTYTDYPDLNCTIGIGDKVAQGFVGKQSRPAFYNSFRSNEQRDEKVQEFLDERKKVMDWKVKQKAENKGKLSGAAATAAEIRKQLKKCFPGVKFSVTSKIFSGGDSVDIDWTDGPMGELVDSITRMYQDRGFDGMTDSSYCIKLDDRIDCPGASYVHANRRLSDEYRAKLDEIAEKVYARNGIGYFSPYQYTEAELELLGKDTEWLKSECIHLRELVLGGPLNLAGNEAEAEEFLNMNIPTESEATEPQGAKEAPKTGKLIMFPGVKKEEPASMVDKVRKVFNALDPEKVGLALEAIKAMHPELIEGLSEERAIMSAASILIDMMKEEGMLK
jgi:hypothetical protein